MFRRMMLCSAALLVAGTAVAVHADPKDDVTAAIQKLADSPNYSWTVTTEVANAQFTPPPQNGKMEKDGYTELTFSFGGNDTDILMKGTKVAVKTDQGWQSSDELAAAGGGFNPARMVAQFKSPVDQIKDMAANMTNVTKTDDGYTATLSDDDATKALTAMRGRRGGGGGGGGAAGGAAPAVTVTNAKVALTFTVGADGSLTKWVVHMTGTRTVEGQDPQDVDRTMTTEVKDVGATKIDVPDDAKAKLGA